MTLREKIDQWIEREEGGGWPEDEHLSWSERMERRRSRKDEILDELNGTAYITQSGYVVFDGRDEGAWIGQLHYLEIYHEQPPEVP